MGTNAIGTAIAALEPVQIYASEHYRLDVKRWTQPRRRFSTRPARRCSA